MKLKNISNSKIIGLGDISVFPGQTLDVPKGFIGNPALNLYKELGLAVITEDTEDVETTKQKKEDKGNFDKEEELRKARLASLKGISDENLAKLADELEINRAECVDTADMLKKVKVALRKK